VDRVDGVEDGILRSRVTAPPIGGAGNDALRRLLARELGVASSSVRIVGGRTGRSKVVAVEGVDRERLVARWPGLAV
jgi:uncharacterized protein YggU (UPF0235/DUF167 family)